MALKPIRHQVYTFSEIQNLSLRDSPCLGITIDTVGSVSKSTVIQDSHCSEAVMLEALKNLSFKYLYESNEWIPVFECVNTSDEILACVDIDIDVHPDYLDDEGLAKLMAWPKGSQREQFYKVTEAGTHCTNVMDPIEEELSEKTIKAIKDLAAWKAQRG